MMMMKYKDMYNNYCTIDIIYRDDTSEDHGGMLILKLVNVKNVKKGHKTRLTCRFSAVFSRLVFVNVSCTVAEFSSFENGAGLTRSSSVARSSS